MSFFFAFGKADKKSKDAQRKEKAKAERFAFHRGASWFNGKPAPHLPTIHNNATTPYGQTPSHSSQSLFTQTPAQNQYSHTQHSTTTPSNNHYYSSATKSQTNAVETLSSPPRYAVAMQTPMSPSNNERQSFTDYQKLLLNQQIDNFALQAVKLPEPERDNKNLTSNYFKNKMQGLQQQEQHLLQPSLDQSVLKRIDERMKNPDDYQDFMDVVEDDGKDELKKKRLEPITPGDKQKIQAVLNGPANSSVVIDKFSIDMTRQKIACLRPSTWLNDEVVNFYMAMLLDRDTRLCAESKAAGKVRHPSYFFNSFFVSKLLEGGVYDYGKVKRWTKKFDVFAQDKIFFPVNLNNTHWTMAVVYIRRKEIHYYDSMNGAGKQYLNALLRWVGDESKEKKKVDIVKEEWKLVSNEEDVPQQKNGFDCGMFSIMCADYLADELPFGHNQSQMPENRLKVGAAILNGTLPY